MNKQEFLLKLSEGLSDLPREEIGERLSFYSEMIDDRVEEGLSEAEAVEEIGQIDNIVSQIIDEKTITKPAGERIRTKRRLRAWEIVLLVLGSPLWLPLLLVAFALLLTVYIMLWVIVLSLWSVELSLIAGTLGGVATGVLSIVSGGGLRELILFSMGLVLAGLSILLFFGCKAATAGTFILTKKIALKIKALFTGRRMQDETGN